jgi:hypothetical protein
MGFDAYALKGGLEAWRKAAGEKGTTSRSGAVSTLQPSS